MCVGYLCTDEEVVAVDRLETADAVAAVTAFGTVGTVPLAGCR